MAYLLSNICTTNYWNRTTTVEIIVDGWVVSFIETVYRLALAMASEPCQGPALTKASSAVTLGIFVPRV